MKTLTANTKLDSIEGKVTSKAVQSVKIYFQNTECVCNIEYLIASNENTANTKPDSIESKVTIKAVQSGKIYFQNTECVCNIEYLSAYSILHKHSA